MRLLWGCPLLLVSAAFLLGGCFDSSGHSLFHFCTTIWMPDQGVSDFIAVSYLDDQLGGHYNSTTRRAVSRVPWGRKVEKENPRFWDWITERAFLAEQRMKMHLMSLQNIYNLSRGLHTLQHMHGCRLSKDGRKEGFHQYSYNGEDFLSFDKETLTWTAAIVSAQVTKRAWDEDLDTSRVIRAVLEEDCIGFLQKFLYLGKASLLRREPPVVTVKRKAEYDGLETLVCRAHGFFPKEIDATWRKDGEVWEQETFRGGVLPNSDGTYHTWLSVRIHPEDRDRYRCHVEHDGLPEPLDLGWEEPVLSKVGLIVGIFLGIAATLLVTGIIFCFWRRRRNYPAARRGPPME